MFKFYKTSNDTVLMAIFIAEIVRQGLTYKIHDDVNSVEVELTGGF